MYTVFRGIKLLATWALGPVAMGPSRVALYQMVYIVSKMLTDNQYLFQHTTTGIQNFTNSKSGIAGSPFD